MVGDLYERSVVYVVLLAVPLLVLTLERVPLDLFVVSLVFLECFLECFLDHFRSGPSSSLFPLRESCPF